ncbi:flagellar assembly protein FliH [Acidihalobacter ferrooxydans]|uniref:Flagellar assembly protein FliH n=1 Tax=Acidihalobacter ferrooxydans TaxID=1765967 RepID=A0A1P8UGV2_9GAMM|nr:flagellar assembly protein FliH [Acidihalobacter ferrooxydans]APZ43004.1 hypothetical protein BW247_07790 [Acidihalobacter ferrooxydans]
MAGKIVPGNQADRVSLWQAPMVGGSETAKQAFDSSESAVPPAPAEESPMDTDALPPLMTAEALEALQEAARKEGFEQGYEEGLASGRRTVEQQVHAWQALLDHLARPLEELDERVGQELIALAIAMTRQIVRRELKTAPDEVIGVVKEALALLPSQASQVKVDLHPEDAALIRQTLPEGEGEKFWQIVENPALTRGGCQVSTANSQIDATVEKRLNQVFAAALGHVRGGEVA